MKVALCFPQGPQSNNGMHPTADTMDFMLRESLRAAGDAGR